MTHLNGIEIAWPFIGPVQNGGGVAPYYGPGTPFTSPSGWTTHVTSAVWSTIIAAGYDCVRIPFPPGTLIDCIGNATQTAIVLAALDVAVNDCITNGLGVILCLEDSFDVAAYSPGTLVAGGTSSAVWQSRVSVTAAMAAHVAANWAPAQVCLELFDEPPAPANILGNTWAQYQATLYAAARAAAPLHALLLTEPDFSAIADLVAIDPGIYDANTMFVVHNYLPSIFAQQGLMDGFHNWVNGIINWPPDKSQQAAAISSMTANVNADAGVPSGSKAAVIASQTSQLNSWFNTPQNLLYVNQQFDLLVNWCNTHGIPPSRVFITEFGTTRTNSGGFGGSAFTGVPQASRVQWKSDMRGIMAARGFRRCEFALDDPRYGITSGTGTAIGTINT